MAIDRLTLMFTGELAQVSPSPILGLNRAVAVAFSDGPQARPDPARPPGPANERARTHALNPAERAFPAAKPVGAPLSTLQPVLDDKEFDRWRESAADALAAARDTAERGWHNWACMMAEQSAQLAVKAALHGVGRGDRARGHDLVQLLDAAADLAGLTVTDELRESAARLGRHYQPTRYPDALPGGTPRGRYTRADAEEALADAEAVARSVDAAAAAVREATER